MSDPMETLHDAISRLRAAGYQDDLWIAEDGRIAAADSSWNTEDVVVREVARFEGASNPDDESMLLGIELPDDRRGLLTVPYGPDLSGAQAETIRGLRLRRHDPTD